MSTGSLQGKGHERKINGSLWFAITAAPFQVRFLTRNSEARKPFGVPVPMVAISGDLEAGDFIVKFTSPAEVPVAASKFHRKGDPSRMQLSQE